MVSPASYQPVASSDDVSTPPGIVPLKRNHHKFASFKLLGLLLAFCLVAFGSYKVGQWSIPKEDSAQLTVEKPVHDTETSLPSQGTSEQAEPADKETNKEMASGKHSVG